MTIIDDLEDSFFSFFPQWHDYVLSSVHWLDHKDVVKHDFVLFLLLFLLPQKNQTVFYPDVNKGVKEGKCLLL